MGVNAVQDRAAKSRLQHGAPRRDTFLGKEGRITISLLTYRVDAAIIFAILFAEPSDSRSP